jgi:hypothetical protein
MKIKYQIFISSTYEDLREERELVIKAILEMGHIPVGMEMFSAGDEEQWKLIMAQIDDCDYYLVVVAHRYGSMDGDLSYTEKEYDYACSKEKPTLGFIIEAEAQWSVKKIEKDKEKANKLEMFKEKVKKKVINYWSDKKDLYGKVGFSLMKQFNTNPQPGWVKASPSSGVEVLQEISRLSSENALLRQKLEELKQKEIIEEATKYEHLISRLRRHEVKISFLYHGQSKWESGAKFNFLDLFTLIAPQLMIEKSTEATASYIGFMKNPDKNRKLHDKYPIPSNVMKTILGDLVVFDLVKPSKRKHSVKDNNDYWTISEEGRNLYKVIRKKDFETNEPK